MRRLLLTGLMGTAFLFARGQQSEARWLMFPAISPDGESIVFGYQGNIYKVGAQGGVATALTSGDAYYQHPVWSRDGKTLAFSNDRYGNFDVYTMSSIGGPQTRITYHSADDIAYDFTPDGKYVLIGSRHEAPAESIRFPGVRYFQNLYNIPVNGGRARLITAAGVDNGRYNADGSQIVFQDVKGYEDYYRKHEQAAISQNVWVYNVSNDSYRQITADKFGNRVPAFSNSGDAIYYTSQKNGDFNVFKKASNGSSDIQLTNFKGFPVRYLSVSSNNRLAFSWKGDLYTMTDGGTPQKLNVQITNNTGYNTIQHQKIDGVTEFQVSPSGKEIAFINRGEVFVTSVDTKETKRITNTPEQERMLAWSPDGKTLLFSGERDGSWNIYKTTLSNPAEKFFYSATTVTTTPLVATANEEFQPKYSPDGKKVAYIQNRNVLKVIDLATGNKVTALPEGQNHSYSDGDWDFEWSPDSKWLLVDDQKGHFSNSNSALVSADGKGTITYPVNSGFGDGNAKWAMGGKAMTYESSKLGRKPLAFQGSRESDVYALFLLKKITKVQSASKRVVYKN